jgi:hypothetical protein
MADMQIAEFLEARWAEREAVAKAAGYGAAGDYLWQEVDPDRMPGLVGTGCGDVVTFNQGTPAYAVSPSPGQAAHIALNDPASVLADIKAQRKILELADKADQIERALCDEVARRPVPGEVSIGDEMCRALAAPFAAHPEFDPSWRLEP